MTKYTMNKSKKRNPNKIAQWFITFPQSGDLKREEFAKSLPPSDFIKVVQETHKDGGFHLHAICILKTPLSKPNLMKTLAKKYPGDSKKIDYESVRSISHSAVYLDKEDTTPYIEGVMPRRKLRSMRAIRKYFTDNPREYYQLLFDVGFAPTSTTTIKTN